MSGHFSCDLCGAEDLRETEWRKHKEGGCTRDVVAEMREELDELRGRVEELEAEAALRGKAR